MAERRPDRVRGPGHDTFWQWCAEDQLRVQRCASCGALAWPVVQACTTCGGGDFAWQRLSGRGRIVSWCAFHQDYYRGILPVPYDTILVELEEGPLFVSNPADLTYETIEAGMRVAVRFVDAEDAGGPYRLPVFAPDQP